LEFAETGLRLRLVKLSKGIEGIISTFSGNGRRRGEFRGDLSGVFDL
jgi:hypothetical protein